MESTKEVEKPGSKPALTKPKEKPKKEEIKKAPKPEEEKKDSTRKDISDLLGTLGGGSKDKGSAEEEVKEIVEGSESDLRIAVIGNVDSGKSTLVGVLTKGLLDDGRGAAR